MPTVPAAADLPPAALPAWQAYHAMLASKRAHFDALTAADGGRGHGLARGAQLDELRARHDACVRAFAVAVRALAARDAAAHRALVAAITVLNEADAAE